MKRLIGLIEYLSEKGKYRFVVLAFIATIIVMYNDSFGHMYILKHMPEFEMIDMTFFTTPENLFRYIQALGSFGRTYYIVLLIIDMVLLITFFLLIACTMMRLMRMLRLDEKYYYLVGLPLLRSVMDLFESTSLMIQTGIYPEKINGLLVAASIATPLKWVSLWLSLVVIGSLIIILLINQITRLIKRKVIK